MSLPEEAQYTSLATRLAWCRKQGRMSELQAARKGSVPAATQARGMERGLWLCPLDDRRQQGETRVGVLAGFSLGSYLLLVDATSRLLRPGKARVDPQVEALLDRLGVSWRCGAPRWSNCLPDHGSSAWPSPSAAVGCARRPGNAVAVTWPI